MGTYGHSDGSEPPYRCFLSSRFNTGRHSWAERHSLVGSSDNLLYLLDKLSLEIAQHLPGT
jgi:hypothetical protein